MPKFRYIGDHAHEFEKGDKRVQVGNGEFIDLTAEEQKDESVKELLDNEMLIPVKEVTK